MREREREKEKERETETEREREKERERKRRLDHNIINWLSSNVKLKKNFLKNKRKVSYNKIMCISIKKREDSNKIRHERGDIVTETPEMHRSYESIMKLYINVNRKRKENAPVESCELSFI